MAKNKPSLSLRDNKLWFRGKKYGWGWFPATRQGWVTVALYLAFVLVVSFGKPTDISMVLILTAIATAILIFICYKKGEKPRWRWGK